ncbi:MAG: hypothetical protein ACLGIV_07365 [Actinomycetes bacterium]
MKTLTKVLAASGLTLALALAGGPAHAAKDKDGASLTGASLTGASLT